MNKDTNTVSNPKDTIIWVVIAGIVVGAISANSYYGVYPLAVRLIGWIVAALAVLGLILLTAKGQQLKQFANEARVELKKVVWPTKQETVQTTLVVFAMVIVVGLFLWLADSLFLWFVGKITM